MTLKELVKKYDNGQLGYRGGLDEIILDCINHLKTPRRKRDADFDRVLKRLRDALNMITVEWNQSAIVFGGTEFDFDFDVDCKVGIGSKGPHYVDYITQAESMLIAEGVPVSCK